MFPISCRRPGRGRDAHARRVPSATDRPTEAMLSAAFSLLVMMFCAICCMSTKPSTATTSPDTTKVAVITRSCSDRRHWSPRRAPARPACCGAAGNASRASRLAWASANRAAASARHAATLPGDRCPLHRWLLLLACGAPSLSPNFAQPGPAL